MTNLSITGRHLEVTPALRQRIEEKISKLHKYSHHIIEANVILSVEKYRHVAEIILQLNGATISAQGQTEDMYASLDRALEKIERQLHRYKERYDKRKARQAAQNAKKAPQARNTDWEAEDDQLMLSKKFASKPMSTEEAVMQMELVADEFLAFTNAQTDRVNIIYRRKDGKLGLIEPDY